MTVGVPKSLTNNFSMKEELLKSLTNNFNMKEELPKSLTNNFNMKEGLPKSLTNIFNEKEEQRELQKGRRTQEARHPSTRELWRTGQW